MTKSKATDPRRTGGLVAVRGPAERVTRVQFGRHGFAGAALVADWPAVVGSAVAFHTQPLRIMFPPKERVGGTLVVKVAASAFATELQHLEPLVIERVNGYFGWNAVARLKLVHGPLPDRSRPPRVPEPPTTAQPWLEDSLAKVEDPDLKQALARLGRWIGEKSVPDRGGRP